jgi:hypothetical protein
MEQQLSRLAVDMKRVQQAALDWPSIDTSHSRGGICCKMWLDAWCLDQPGGRLVLIKTMTKQDNDAAYTMLRTMPCF